MRVGYLVNQYPKVSHVFIRREILALEQAGIEVVRIAIRGWEEDSVDPEDAFERQNTRYVLHGGAPALLLAATRTFFTHPVAFIRAVALTWRMGRCADRPLAVHFVYLAEACRIEQWLRTAAVTHLHAHFGTNSAEVAMLVQSLGGPHWSFTAHGPEEFDRAPVIGLAEKMRRCAFVVTISSHGRSQLYRVVDHQNWSKVHLVSAGLGSEYRTISASPVPEARRLVCVGRLCEQKGQLLLVEATRRLADNGSAFELVLVGDGEMRDEIEALITCYKLQSTVRIAGRVSSEQLRNEILASRALVLPSFAEGLPGVIMEAMALRRPIISTFIAGIPELVLPGEHGWLVPAGDLDALVDAMRACLDAPIDALRCMGDAARNRVLARHNPDIQVAQLIALFKSQVDAPCRGDTGQGKSD